jgi:tol-pal system protein YbgF
MKPARALTAAALVPALAGCFATKRDVQDLRAQMENDRAEQNRQIQMLVQRTEALLDSLSGQNARLRADVANRLLGIDRQLVQIQALSGQSQQQIRDLQHQIEQRAEEARQAQAAADSIAAAPADDTPSRPAATDDRTSADRSTSDRGTTDRTATRPSSTTTTPPAPRPGSPTRRAADDGVTPDDAYQAAMGAYQRGSLTTARGGFQEFLSIAPNDRRAPDAQFYVGETYTRDPDAAIAAYQRVVDRWPQSSRAPTALLRIAKLEIARGDRTQARAHLNQVLRSYPRSDEADEARTQLARLGSR